METSKTSTGEQSNDLTLFAVATPANHSPQQAKEKAQTTLDTCGLGSEMPLAHYDQSTQSWRMSEDISLWGDYKSLESLPKSGMTRNGVLYQQPEWVRPIDANESLSWPTPTASDWKGRGPNSKQQGLPEVVKTRMGLWPTPTTQEVEHPKAEITETGRRKSKDGKTSHSLGLADAVQMWPTPQARDYKGPSGRSLKGTEMDLPMAVGGKLSPMWVEWLMGFPAGWTDLKD